MDHLKKNGNTFFTGPLNKYGNPFFTGPQNKYGNTFLNNDPLTGLLNN